MYTKMIPHKNFRDQPRNYEVQFNLTEREVFKLLVEFKAVFDWQESMKGTPRELPTEEVVAFYNNFEKILLEAYSKISADGDHFVKTDRYQFEDSALFAACMAMYVSQPEETAALIDGLMPKGMEELVRTATDNLAKLDENGEVKPETEAELLARLEEIRKRDAATATAESSS